MKPEISLALTLIVLLIADLFMGEKSKQYFQPLALVLFAAHTAINFCDCCGGSCMAGQSEAFSGMYITSNIHVFVKNMLNVGTLLVFLFSFEWNKKENKEHIAEFYLLMMATLFGMYLMISCGDFLLFYIGLETASIPMATLVALNKKRNESAEAAAKYILTAGFSSSVMLFGISLIYGSCGGSLYFCDVVKNFTAEPFQILAMIFFMAGPSYFIDIPNPSLASAYDYACGLLNTDGDEKVVIPVAPTTHFRMMIPFDIDAYEPASSEPQFVIETVGDQDPAGMVILDRDVSEHSVTGWAADAEGRPFEYVFIEWEEGQYNVPVEPLARPDVAESLQSEDDMYGFIFDVDTGILSRGELRFAGISSDGQLYRWSISPAIVVE